MATADNSIPLAQAPSPRESDLPSKSLLVLDLDETLIFGTEERLDRDPDFEVGPYAVYKRPGLDAFLTTMEAHFDLSVWTSSTRLYAEPVVANIFPAGLELKFVWARDRCTMRFDPENHDYEWAKNLNKLSGAVIALSGF